jgi:hypothetical protein
VQKFTSDGKFIRAWGSHSNATGQFIATWGSFGDGDGQFTTADGIAIDDLGDMFVNDWNGSKVNKFTSDGKFVTSFGSAGSRDGQISSPSDIEIDSQGKIYVTDFFNYRVDVFAVARAPAEKEEGNEGGNAMPPMIGGHTFAPITMEEMTGNNTWNVKINWFTNDIGKQNVFAITLSDPKSSADVQDAEFDFSILQEGKVLMKSPIAEPTSPGQAYGAQYNFTNAGSYVVRIDNINSRGGKHRVSGTGHA